jgi:hypothetical protein
MASAGVSGGVMTKPVMLILVKTFAEAPPREAHRQA